MKRRKYFIIPMMALLMVGNVKAITSNDVTYDNNGTSESLTTSLDTLYGELNKYKTGGSVQANQMLAGVTGYSKGVLVTGTIPSRGTVTYTPGTTNQTIGAGQYLSGAQTIIGDPDLVAGNIRSGVNIFGVNGTYTSDANANASTILAGYSAYVNGSKVAGSMPNRSSDTGTVGLSWATGRAELVGNQLRVGINPGYYGSSNYSSFGTPGVVINNFSSVVDFSTMFTPSTSTIHQTIVPSCMGNWQITTALPVGTYIVSNTMTRYDGKVGSGSSMTFATPNPAGVSVTTLSAYQNGITYQSVSLVKVTSPLAAGTEMGLMYTCDGAKANSTYGVSIWSKVG